MKLKIQRINTAAKLPIRAYKHDAGYDLYSAEEITLKPGERAAVKTGIKMAIPAGCAGLVWDKGGVANAGIHCLAGVVDAGFRGEVTVHLVNLSDKIHEIKPGQKIAQMLIQKTEFPGIEEGEITDETERGTGRFGSSGIF
jgi:dUTP pyrophosphatase